MWKRTPAEERIRTLTKMYELAMELFDHKYDAIIRVLIRRWAAFVRCDDERQKWMAAAKNAQRQLEEVQRKNRALRKESTPTQ
jgi:hypothetical protein